MIPIRMLSGRALNFSGKVPSTRSIPTFPCDFSNNPLTTSCTIPSPPTQTTLKIFTFNTLSIDNNNGWDVSLGNIPKIHLPVITVKVAGYSFAIF